MQFNIKGSHTSLTHAVPAVQTRRGHGETSYKISINGEGTRYCNLCVLSPYKYLTHDPRQLNARSEREKAREKERKGERRRERKALGQDAWLEMLPAQLPSRPQLEVIHNPPLRQVDDLPRLSRCVNTATRTRRLLGPSAAWPWLKPNGLELIGNINVIYLRARSLCLNTLAVGQVVTG